jgi:hypothetical protein
MQLGTLESIDSFASVAAAEVLHPRHRNFKPPITTTPTGSSTAPTGCRKVPVPAAVGNIATEKPGGTWQSGLTAVRENQ